jgi:hypothetical protein
MAPRHTVLEYSYKQPLPRAGPLSLESNFPRATEGLLQPGVFEDWRQLVSFQIPRPAAATINMSLDRITARAMYPV